MTRPERDNDKGFIGRMASGASDRVLDFVDPNLVLDHVDIDALLEKVDVNTLLERVDVNRLLERVDIDALMDRVDVDAIMARVDVEDLVERAGVPEIVAQSTSQLTGSALDFFRRPLVGLDEIVFRGLNRLIGRKPGELPEGPGELIEWVEQNREDKEGIKTGRYAGPVTRLLAFLIDMTVVTLGLTLLVAGVVFVVGLFVSDFELPATSGLFYGIVLVTWGFLYFWLGWAVFGKTVGMAVLGLRVISDDGDPNLSGRQPFVRTIVYPFSFIIFLLGLLGVVFNRQRKGWHDHAAHTTVVYDWGSRTATMPTPLANYLERKGSQV